MVEEEGSGSEEVLGVVKVGETKSDSEEFSPQSSPLSGIRMFLFLSNLI